ncbi:MAG: hypothetical protein AB4426_18010 [Xenococcaceae cyanobacterium]
MGRFTQRVTICNAHQTQPFTLEWWALHKNSLFGTDNPLLQCPPYPILLVMANFLMLLLPKTHIPHPAIPESTIARSHIDQFFQCDS